MDRSSRDFFFELLKTPSPSGGEVAIQRKVEQFVEPFAEELRIDLHGNLIAGINTEAERRVMIAGHCDQVGLVVHTIDSGGYIYFEPIGGADPGVLLGARVNIHTREGDVPGVVGKKAKHLQTKSEKDDVPDLEDMWIDVGAKDRRDAERRVEIGDTITFVPEITMLANRLVAAPGLDNKAGLFVMLEALRICADADLRVAVYAVSTVQEELGGRGATTAAHDLAPHIGIAIDTTHATDEPGNKNKRSGRQHCLGGGPIISRGPRTNPPLCQIMMDTAQRIELPYQLRSSGRLAPNDAKHIQVARGAAATIDLGIPIRNMHTQAEVCSLEDLDATIRLLVGFLKRLEPDMPLSLFEEQLQSPRQTEEKTRT